MCAGKNVLEIGAGIGLVSAVISMLGAKEIIATDGDALLLPLLKKNIRKNSPLGHSFFLSPAINSTCTNFASLHLRNPPNYPINPSHVYYPTPINEIGTLELMQ